MTQPLLIYDGDCGFCTSSANLIAGSAGGRVAIEAWQFMPKRLAELGLTAEDGMHQVWLLAPDDRLFGGGAAVDAVARYIWWARPFNWFYALPGAPRLVEWGYRWVADNRYRLPGGTPACAIAAQKSAAKQD